MLLTIVLSNPIMAPIDAADTVLAVIPAIGPAALNVFDILEAGPPMAPPNPPLKAPVIVAVPKCS